MALSAEGLQRASLPQQVAHQVVEFIRSANLTEGDPLPPTRELARRFQVNSGTLREALRQLEATGALSLRHGSGVYVGPNLDRVVLANPTRFGLTVETAAVMIRARIAIEPPIAALAAVHRSDDDLEHLRSTLSIATTPPRPTPEGRRAPNFHRALARASGNHVLAEIIDSLLDVHRVEQHTIRVVYADRRKDFAQHSAIFDAVGARDPEAAARLTTAHLTDILSVVERAQVAGGHSSAELPGRE